MPAILLTGLPWDHELNKKGPVSPRAVRDGLALCEKLMTEAGYDYKFFGVTPEEGVDPLKKELTEKKYDGVAIGFGIRGVPPLTPFFEQIVNAVIDASPGTKLLFNTSPDGTIDAAKRWFPL